jgi:DNA-binding protein HU-beta
MPDKPMTKTQIVAHLAEHCELPKRQAADFIDELFSLATTQAKKNGTFTLPGFGKLVKQARKARMGRNPATGETIKIPAKTVCKFRLSKVCKDAVLAPKK